jgi:hypothetical protein
MIWQCIRALKGFAALLPHHLMLYNLGLWLMHLFSFTLAYVHKHIVCMHKAVMSLSFAFWVELPKITNILFYICKPRVFTVQ